MCKRTFPRYVAFGPRTLGGIRQLQGLSSEQRAVLEALCAVLPFRVNSYVVEELIDWSNIPDDPIFQLTFPQPGMLKTHELKTMVDLIRNKASEREIHEAASKIWTAMNPHPDGQMELNVPKLDGERLEGVQRKYRETVLLFPSAGQSCHAYCTYCFRWPQFVGAEHLRFACRNVDRLVRFLRIHPEITDVLITGGDPMTMNANVLRRYLDPLLSSGIESIRNIRIGTKALSYWPYRFTSDVDADDLMRLFEGVNSSGRRLALMAHFSHPRELSTTAVKDAMNRILSTGSQIRTQAPLIRRINDKPELWAEMWRMQVRMGAVPYYTFIERDTGPKRYFEVSIAEALSIYKEAVSQVSGLGRTVRGPVMSAVPGKVLVDGEAHVDGERVFVLKMIQGRQRDWVNRVFLAKWDSWSTWLDQLQPFGGGEEFFFDSQIREMREQTKYISQYV